MTGVKKKTSRRLNLAIFKKHRSDNKPETTVNTYYTGTSVDDMDLASVKSFFSYECQNSTDIKYGSVSEKLDSVATRWPPTTADCEDKAIVIQELSSSKHNTPTERAGGLNVDENIKCSSAIHKAEQLAVPRTTSCKSEAGNSCQQCTIRYVTDGSNHLNVSSWRQHISQTSTGQIGAPNVDDSLSDLSNNYLQLSSTFTDYQLSASGQKCDTISDDDCHISVRWPPNDHQTVRISPQIGRDPEPDREIVGQFSTSTPLRDNNVRHKCTKTERSHLLGNKWTMLKNKRLSVDDYETVNKSDENTINSSLVSGSNERCKHGEELITKRTATRVLDQSDSVQGHQHFVCVSNTLTNNSLTTNKISCAPGNKDGLYICGNIGEKENIASAYDLELAESSIDECWRRATTTNMSRKSRSVGNILDSELTDGSVWKRNGSVDELAQVKKSDKVSFLKDKIKSFKKLFSRKSNTASNQTTADGNSCQTIAAGLLFQANVYNSGSKEDSCSAELEVDNVCSSKGQTSEGHMRHLYASRDSGFDQRCASTDHDILSSASENKDSSPFGIQDQSEIGPNQVIYESIPSCESQRNMALVDNLLDRCKSFESLSSEEPVHLNVMERSKSNIQLTPQRDLHLPGSYLRFKSHRRRSSCDNLQIISPRSKSWHDISKVRPFESREDMGCNSNSWSSYYGVPPKMTFVSRTGRYSSNSSQELVNASRKYRRPYRRSLSADLLADDRIKRSSRKYIVLQGKQLTPGHSSPDPSSHLSLDQSGLVDRRLNKRGKHIDLNNI
ncbi:hypothetical protein LSH36_150g04011 [Paralvinella palmiformis]|uniref:Uncharacterized protein n=1 Tax=Paralvinella palmiformis TaxID=53620 RepID=A0AAD9JUE7_9ANNE|nr:hypothetical protein LSH36_150g04011 [Paralvinella palmiformis]